MRRRALAPAPERRYSIPDDAPYHCARCGHWLMWGAQWWEYRSTAGVVVARVHVVCARLPLSGFPGYAAVGVR